VGRPIVAGVRFYHTQNSNHLDQKIGLNKHALSFLANVNIVECNVSQEKKKLSRIYPRWCYRHKRNYLRQHYRHEKQVCRLSFLKTSEESRKWLTYSKQRHGVLISLPLSLKKSVRLIWAENERTQLCLQIELGEEKSQSLHSQQSHRWAQEIYVTNEKILYTECYKKVLYAGPKSAWNILTNLSRNFLGPIQKARPDLQLFLGQHQCVA